MYEVPQMSEKETGALQDSDFSLKIELFHIVSEVERE
jgi:hypothetical protein